MRAFHGVTFKEQMVPQVDINLQGLTLKAMAETLTSRCPVGYGIATIIKPNGIVYREYEDRQEGVVFNYMEAANAYSQVKAGWFSVMELFNYPDTAIIMWRPEFTPWSVVTERSREYQQVKGLIAKMGYEVIVTRLSGSEIQLYCGPHALASDNSLLADDFPYLLGLHVDQSIEPGKLLKRLSIFSVAEGSFACHGAFMLPYQDHKTKLQQRREIVLRTLNHSPEADGGMWISRSFAGQLCETTGVAFDDDVTRIQLWITSNQGLVKGMAMVGEGDKWGLIKADIVAPEESIDRKFCMDKVTIGKIQVHRVKRKAPVFKPMDGLLRVPELIKHVSLTELLDRQFIGMQNQDNAEIEFASGLHNLSQDLNPSSVLWDDMSQEDALDTQDQLQRQLTHMDDVMEKRLYNDAARYLSSTNNYSPHIAPEVMQQLTGRVARSLGAKYQSWTDANGTLPGIYVSCLRAYWCHHSFVEQVSPKPGYVGILWNNGSTDIDGFYLHKDDQLSENVRYRSDGGDHDDLLDGVLLEDVNDKLIWLVRNPTSWGGGWFMKVTNEDWDKAVNNGYVPYKLTNLYETPDLVTLSQDPSMGLKVQKYV